MKWKNVLSCSASALALTLVAGQAMAQATDQGAIETVTVTGVRASLKSALEIKKNSDQLIDSVVAEDIGKLPDNNVIEALQHVTGVQVFRSGGEANSLLIRGLPDIATTVNGREIFTTTGRYISLQDIPAELLARVDVHKSAQAQDLEGGIAGLVDARFHRPFDFDGLEIAGGLNGTYSTLAKHVDPAGSILFSNRWHTGIGDIGFLVDVNASKRHYQDEVLYNYLSYGTGSSTAGTAYMPGTVGGIVYPGNRERGGVNLVGQWRPNENTEVYAEVFYTRYRNDNSVDYLIGLPWVSNISTNTTTVTDPDGGVEAKTTASCCYDLTSNQAFRDKTDTYQFATGATWTGGNLTLSTEVDYTDSRYKRRGVILDTIFYPSISYDFNYEGKGTPNLTITDSTYDALDSANYHIRQFYDQWTHQSGNEIDWRGDAAYTVGDSWLKSIDTGLRYTNRFGKNRAANGGGLDCQGSLAGYASSALYEEEVAALSSTACTNMWSQTVEEMLPGSMRVSHGKIFDGDRTFGIRQWMNADPHYLLNHTKEVRALFGQSTSDPEAEPSNSFDDREQSYAFYAKANYGVTLGELPLDGNFGLRIVDTRSEMQGYTRVTTYNSGSSSPVISYEPTEKRKEVVDFMPSFNAKLKIEDDLLLRFAATRTVTRPTFSQLNPGLTLSNSTGTYNGTGSSGNPDLAPVKANNVDLSLEYYFGAQNLVSLTTFYRQIIGYVQSYAADQTIGGVSYAVTAPQNSGQGYLQGIEANYTQFFDQLPGYLSGLGLQLNGTIIEGRTDYSATDTSKVPYLSVSKYSFNIVGIYEYGPISFRTAYNWRSGYVVSLNSTGGAPTQPTTVYATPYGALDLSASYKLEDEGLIFTLDATNLLGGIYQDHWGKGDWASVYARDTRRYDKTLTLGVRYRY